MAEYTAEQLFAPILRGALKTLQNSSPNQFAGRTTIASGSATATVSTNQVNSDSIILATLQGDGTDTASAVGVPVEVKSMASGGYFTVGWQDGKARNFDRTVMWMMIL